MVVEKWNDPDGIVETHVPFGVIIPVDSEHYIAIGLLPSEALICEAAQRNLKAWERRNQLGDSESYWQERFSFSHLLRTTAGGLIQLADEMEANWARQADRIKEDADG